MAQHVLGSEIALHVCSFLDIHSLAAAEQTPLHPPVFDNAWSVLLATRFAGLRSMPWRPYLCPRIESRIPKTALEKMSQQCQSVGKIPQGWAPMVVRLGSAGLRASPRQQAETADTRLQRLSWLGSLMGAVRQMSCPKRNSDRASLDLSTKGTPEDLAGPPRTAFLPLGFAASYGTRMTVGLCMHGAGLCHIADGALLVVDVVGFKGETKRIIKVCFSPCSGRCIIMNMLSGVDLVANVMPPLASALDDEASSSQEIEVWASVSEHRDISFHRRRSPGEAVERSGELSCRSLPSWATEYLASVAFQVDALPASVDVSVSEASFGLPPNTCCQEPSAEMDLMSFSHEKSSARVF